jgi:uncharacterized protein (TIGR00730 family)
VKRLCVFAGSSIGADPAFREAAVELARLLARRGVGVVYGGASIGLMGVVANSVLAAGGEVVGVVPERLTSREIAHRGLSELHVVGSMHERKALMSELSDAAVALPGGLGTFEELLELATWTQLGIDVKPCGLLNVHGYFDPLVAMLDRAVEQTFLSSEHRGILLAGRGCEELLARIERWSAPAAKWSPSAGEA